ncbi:Protein smg5 [Clonorchis sinensis]|uniref:Protein smg5 n=1 Tax=Clonorchis sinensis TaxID=79923 RepID=A0A8T1MQP5_CLOSI|nr:Protein smg5 [Clonorchis sinensis]
MIDTQPSRSDANERTRGLLKAVSDSIKRLTSIYNSGKATKTVFSYEAYGYRLRLKEALQKLMFLSPAHARRAEEMIWRKVFYEPLHLYKVYVKNNDRADHVTDFELALKMHLTSGIGFYQSLLLQLQSEWLDSSRENLLAWLPVPFHIPTYDESIYEFDVKPVFSSFGEKMVQKCLMYIGDLFRYLLEFNESVGKPLAYAYYNAALNFDPSMGLPHNQLGILDVGRCYGLNAIFHYLHCLCARVPFEGARRNLLTVLTKNEIRYRKLFGDKPIFGLYARRPNRYRPKDFRKTITKFIFLIQCFLTQKANGFTAHHSYVFQDTLLELHLMLNLSSALTLEPDRRLDKIGPDDQSSVDDVELRGESSVFSEQLTGPIFVRLLMIALLTANLKLLEQTRATKPEEDTAEDLSSTQNSSEVPVPDSPTESVQSETSSDKVMGIDEFPNVYGLSEPFGPLSFVLQLSELFMSHLATQLNQHLATRELRGSGTFDSSIKDHRPALPDAPDQTTDSVKLVAGEGPYTEVPDRDVNQTERQQRQTVELGNSTVSSDGGGGGGGFVRRRIRKGSGDDSTERDLEGTDGEEEDAEEDAEEEDEMDYSEEADLSADLWSSDDSSPFHSQDDVDSSALSSDENGEFRSDHRLRRGRLGGGVTKRSARSGQPTEPDGKTDTTHGKAHSEAVCGASVRLRRKDHRTDLLDPITEEEAPLRDRRPKAENSTGWCLLLLLFLFPGGGIKFCPSV